MASEYDTLIKTLRAGQKPQFPVDFDTIDYARRLDAADRIGSFRDKFIIPSRASLKKKRLDGRIPGEGTKDEDPPDGDDAPSVYFVGNSLGAQPRSVRQHLDAQLETWASIGVNGHFSSLEDSPLAAWQDMAADCAAKSVDLVGAASPAEVVYMNSLTVNLHLLLASFYRPTPARHKVLVEWKPFPSDAYAIASQIQWHGFDPATSLVEIHPDGDGDDGSSLYLSTAKILAAIDEHADSAALLLLPGIQYYTGQLFDMARITRHARARGLTVGWDLAHAVGNVELALHDWGVDFAVWCTYKYLNAGPGAIAGAFVHERHHHHSDGHGHGHGFPRRLAGWYGADKRVRFDMDPCWARFRPAPGAHAWQVSNPSAADLAALTAALAVFADAGGMPPLRDKALVLTAYLEALLLRRLCLAASSSSSSSSPSSAVSFRIVTPENPLERGCQLSLLMLPRPDDDGRLLERVSAALAERGVVCDVRKPGVVRVAPAPLYCRFEDVWLFVDAFRSALEAVASTL